ncbi:MAG: hypothetical protein F9K16_00290 [Thermoanaerobaculia bacterium]|nr:MAG: hypothetical protein F9K16_00290 [Thermoanaerobaculia bacterium]
MLKQPMRNLLEIVSVPAGRQEEMKGAFPARMQVTTETRRSFEEAVSRLGEIDDEWPGKSRWRLLRGWPTLEKRYTLPIARRGEPLGNIGPERSSPSLTVAVAYGTTLVRVETHLLPEADPKLLELAARAAGEIALEKEGDPGAGKRALERLQTRQPAAPERSEPGDDESPGHGGFPAGPLPFDRFHYHLMRNLHLLWDDPNPVDDPVLAVAGGAEISVAVSDDAQDIVVATNGGFSNSNDGGQTFNFRGGTPGPNANVDGDPSVAWAQSGTFYYGFIGFPNGTAAWGGQNGCSTGISASSDGGQTFNFVANAVLCSNAAASFCFPDQEHIAADRENAAAGNDQIYSVWRNFVPGGAAASCNFGSGFVTPSIVCSQDGGANWTAPAAVGTGDFPRITVGGDGFVYVAYRSGGSILLNKFSSCRAGLAQQAGFPVTVASFTSVPCPMPGLDRCNDGNILSSPTVAVSDRNDDRVFVAFATNTVAGNENVVVRESRDGGASFPRSTSVNRNVAGRRFMPWVCAANGRAYASFYDRRNVTAANNDLTGFYLGEAIPDSSSISRGTELDLTGAVDDPQCASGWPCRPRSSQDAESCSVQPQMAGRCGLPGGGGSNAPCDYSTGCAAPGEVCRTGGGCPRYGDYNYVACAGDRIVTAWASATPPAGIAGAVPAGVNTYVRVVDAGDAFRCLPWNCGGPILPGPDRLVLECAVRGCRIFDPIPKNCLVKWNCPGCPPGALCPPFYEMRFHGLDPEVWQVELVDAEGEPVRFDSRWDGETRVLTFRPDRKRFIDGQIGDYVLVFTLGPKGIPGKAYEIRTDVKRLDKAPDWPGN